MVMILAGGTGGHVFPALSVAEQLRARNIDVHWLGVGRELEMRLAPQAGLAFDTIPVGRLRGLAPGAWPRAAWKLGRALVQTLRLMLRVRPDCVLGMGGYSAGPGGLVAALLRCPLLIHEQNAIPGLSNRILHRFAREVLEGFPGAFSDPDARFVGNPVRESLTRLPPPAERLAGRSGALRLLVLGGSQGAAPLNRTVPAALRQLPDAECPEVWHQCGSAMQQEVRRAWGDIPVRVDAFIEDMAQAYHWAELVLCRSGAMTLSELAAVGLGAILTPLPHAADDHQRINAEYFVRAGAARLLPEEQLNASSLGAVLGELGAERSALLGMAEAAARLGQPEAARRVADACERMLGRNHAGA